MRTERISIFNYEAFYLDHLEGTLGEEDTALLLAFLEENPSLKMFDESLPTFDTEDFQLTNSEKYSLKHTEDDEAITLLNVEHFLIASAEGVLPEEKQVELEAFISIHPELENDQAYFKAAVLSPDESITFEAKNDLKSNLEHSLSDTITATNAEYFMIACTEGILSKEKSEEFAAFVSSHPALIKDKAYFAATVLSPDMSITYENKAGLKRKAIVFWPYMAIAAAASVIIAFFLLTNGQLEEIPRTANNPDDTEQVDENKTDLLPIKDNSQIADDTKVDQETPGTVRIPTYRNVTNSLNQPKDELIEDRAPMVALERRDARKLIHALEGYELQPIARDLPTNTEESTSYSDVAYTGFGHMTDPIQGVTSRINKRVKPEVDFRTAKATEKQSGGFYIKIGKFELLRKKHKP
ncbi:MAG: hypothetical protein ACI865_001683 [Flavobacteriaceae bacterium]|jgi:hypothetical protein